MRACRQHRGDGDEHRGHDSLREHATETGVQPRKEELLPLVGAQALIAQCRLLIGQHPGHYHRADIGCDQLHEAGLADRYGQGVLQKLYRRRRGQERGDEKKDLAHPHGKPDPLSNRIAARRHHPQQSQRHDAVALPDLHAPERHGLADDAELRDQPEDARGEQGHGHHPGGDRPDFFPQERRHAHAPHDPQANRQLLRHEQDWDQADLQREQRVPPFCSGLRGRDQAWTVGVG
mmetsp:Transcript_53131/g.153326  ORF Transcript_53131/g.153326 Transcript_53131/m.153326 type:complete len:234 (+) Transcript_53131:473-1174(+)